MNKKVVCEPIYILRSNDLNPDPRVDKYVHFFKHEGLPYRLVGWNREAAKINAPHTDYYNHYATYGSGLKNLWGMICWNIFLFVYLFRRRKYIKVIHACDFDTIMPALLMKLFVNMTVIFDVFDWYTDSRNINNRLIKLALCSLEKVAVRKSDYIIICEPERIVQLGNVNQAKVLTMPNIPDFPVTSGDMGRSFNSHQEVSIGYVGILSRFRGLEALLKVVSEMPTVTLHIAGFGELESMVLEYANHYHNILFEGKVAYEQGLSILASSDCIYAMYYTNVKNHILAAPNKFYESLYLGRPLITTIGTLVGEKVQKYDSGFVIEEGKEALRTLLSNINMDICMAKGKKAYDCWQHVFCEKIASFFKNEYAPIIYTCI